MDRQDLHLRRLQNYRLFFRFYIGAFVLSVALLGVGVAEWIWRGQPYMFSVSLVSIFWVAYAGYRVVSATVKILDEQGAFASLTDGTPDGSSGEVG